MDIFAVIVCAVCAALFAALLRSRNREYSLLIALVACVLILTRVLGELTPLIAELRGFGSEGALSGEALTVLLKAVGVAVAGQFSAKLCADAGESALAYTVDLAAKAAILALSLPLFVQIFGYLEEIISL